MCEIKKTTVILSSVIQMPDTIQRNGHRTAYNAELIDGEKEIDKLRIVYPEKQILNVSGNCDYNSFTPDSDLYNAGRVKIFYTHGHRFRVKYDLDDLYDKGRSLGAQVILFGHTHERFYKYYRGVHMLNPGSAAQPRDGQPPSYAFVDITPSGILCCHVDLVD